MKVPPPYVITPETLERYRSKNGSECPFCRHRTLRYHGIYRCGGGARQDCTCSKCGGHWTEFYIIVKLEGS